MQHRRSVFVVGGGMVEATAAHAIATKQTIKRATTATEVVAALVGRL